MRIILGAVAVILIIIGACLGLMLAAMSVGSPRAQTMGGGGGGITGQGFANNAIIIWQNGRVDINWSAVRYCREPICLAVLEAARCK